MQVGSYLLNEPYWYVSHLNSIISRVNPPVFENVVCLRPSDYNVYTIRHSTPALLDPAMQLNGHDTM